MPRVAGAPCAGFGASSSPFGTTSPSPFGAQTPAFGQNTSPFGATTTTGVFGQVGPAAAAERCTPSVLFASRRDPRPVGLGWAWKDTALVVVCWFIDLLSRFVCRASLHSEPHRLLPLAPRRRLRLAPRAPRPLVPPAPQPLVPRPAARLEPSQRLAASGPPQRARLGHLARRRLGPAHRHLARRRRQVGTAATDAHTRVLLALGSFLHPHAGSSFKLQNSMRRNWGCQ